MTDRDLNRTLADLQAVASLSFDQARAMPPAMYHDEAILRLEEEKIFRGQWLCAGRADGLANAGDYLTYDLMGEPIIVVRDKAGDLRAMSNVCRHRMSTLLEGAGNAKRIVCPYHAWTYGLDGGLMGAPYMDGNPSFDRKDYCLPEVRLEEWHGWIYVTLDADLPSVDEQLQLLWERVVKPYGMADYVQTFREEHVWRTNWKILAENFMESYHLFRLHAATIGPHSNVEDMECPEGGETFNFHWIVKESSLAMGNAHPENTRLEGDWRKTTALIAIYPSHLITLTPGYFWYLSLQPRGVDHVHIVYGGGFAPEFAADPNADEMAAELKVLLDETNEEDRIGVARVFDGTAGGLAAGGHLSHLERPNYEFGRYIAGILCDTESASGRNRAAE